MSSSDSSLGARAEDLTLGLERENYLNSPKGIRSWLFTLDHKRIAVLYLVSILTAFFLGGMFALLVRMELWSPAAGSSTRIRTTSCSRCTAR